MDKGETKGGGELLAEDLVGKFGKTPHAGSWELGAGSWEIVNSRGMATMRRLTACSYLRERARRAS